MGPTPEADLSSTQLLLTALCLLRLQMLYDNGQLAQTYLDAFGATGNAAYARVAQGILDYLRRDMTHPDGGIFSAEVPVLLDLKTLHSA